MHINLELKFFLQLVCVWKEKKNELYALSYWFILLFLKKEWIYYSS